MIGKIGLGVAFSALMIGSGYAADLMVDAPVVDEVAMSSLWDGVYLGIQGGYDFDGHGNLQGVVGVNFTASESFLIGIEGAIGGYSDFSGGDGYEGYIAARAGFVAGSALLYALGGASIVDGDFGWVGGVGAEFALDDTMSIRGQLLDYNGDFLQADVGVMWHF